MKHQESSLYQDGSSPPATLLAQQPPTQGWPRTATVDLDGPCLFTSHAIDYIYDNQNWANSRNQHFWFQWKKAKNNGEKKKQAEKKAKNNAKNNLLT